MESLNIATPLEKAEIAFFSPDQRRLNVLGQKFLTITYQGRSCDQNIYIIKDLKNNLLSSPAIRGLEMLLHMCSIDKSIISQYPALFTGLGTFAQAYTIKLKTQLPAICSQCPTQYSSATEIQDTYNLNCSVCKVWG